MKNLDIVSQECFQILEALQIPYACNVLISYNRRLVKKWGYCRQMPDGTFAISISAILGQDDTPDQALKSVILHELLHTCPGCFNHGKLWKSYGKAIKKAYGIKIRATSDADSMNVEEHYYIKCRHCKSKTWYPMRPRNIDRRCLVCGSAKLSCFYKDDTKKHREWKRR